MSGANQEGQTTSFYYQDSPGVFRKTWCESPPLFTSQWAGFWVQSLDGQTSDRAYEWLTYLGTDGAQWHCKAHVETVRDSGGNPYLITEFEDELVTKQGNKRSQWIGIVDWEGTKWKVEIKREIIWTDRQPRFNLTKVPSVPQASPSQPSPPTPPAQPAPGKAGAGGNGPKHNH